VASAKKRGLNGIALTNHDCLVEVGESRSDGFLLIPGIEVTSRGGHILALGVLRAIAKGMSAAETIKTIKDLGGVAIIAHPGSRLENGVPTSMISELEPDGIEVVNSLAFPFGLMTKRSHAIAVKYGLAEVGGSDSHIPKTVGKAYTIVDTPSGGIQDILESIRRGRTTPVGSATTISERVEKICRQLTCLAGRPTKKRSEVGRFTDPLVDTDSSQFP
jgi:predicted metal-dependent phosphoesterase TrpH